MVAGVRGEKNSSSNNNNSRKILEIATHYWLCIILFCSVLQLVVRLGFIFSISNSLAPSPSHPFHYSCIHAYKCVSLKQKPNLVCRIIVLRFIFRSINSDCIVLFCCCWFASFRFQNDLQTKEAEAAATTAPSTLKVQFTCWSVSRPITAVAFNRHKQWNNLGHFDFENESIEICINKDTKAMLLVAHTLCENAWYILCVF